jgi:ABC-type multidrug transport system ATPase subunit
MGREPIVHGFTSRDSLNEWFYNHSREQTGPQFVAMGIGFQDFYELNEIFGESNHTDSFVVYWNSSESEAHFVSDTIVNRLQWKRLFGRDRDFRLSRVELKQRIVNMGFGYLAPMLVSDGVIALLPLLITQPITDIAGDVRQYMISCTLTLPCYWLAAFVIDFGIWVVTVTLIWLIFLAAQIGSFIDNVFTVWYSLVMSGPSFILLVYCLVFLFKDAASAARQGFMVMMIILIIPIVLNLMVPDLPRGVDWFFGFIPVLHIARILNYVLINMGIYTHTFGYYWRESKAQPALIFEWVDILLYGGLLALIECVRLRLRERSAKRSFGDYSAFFEMEKARHPVTDEARAMEEEVANTHDGYAVRIENCSRLFFNTAGDPIAAVNCVSLGVKEGSLFGFLGANGAGKTTLIKMITSMLPCSAGKIEILGRDIAEHNDPRLLSICPQFNTHLCQELTPYEHFVMYSMLFELDPYDAASDRDRLISVLELEALQDKPLRELSAGDVRKLAIGLSFLGPARIILLDEPTASLDAVARHHVHEMISSYRGEKTFMLCTHLLSEAEALCDNISIMVRGCVYTVGSPGYLSDKFGTEFKVDVMLNDAGEESAKACDKFFSESIPDAIMAIARPKARIYNVPAAGISLPQLFTLIEAGRQSECGFNYYTCSSSSLERVFMEIVHMSESTENSLNGD